MLWHCCHPFPTSKAQKHPIFCCQPHVEFSKILLKDIWSNIKPNHWRKRKITQKRRKNCTSSKTLLSLPLSTITVVFLSRQRVVIGTFRSGCSLSSISFIWSPPLLPEDSTDSVSVALKPWQLIVHTGKILWTWSEEPMMIDYFTSDKKLIGKTI